MYPTFGAAPALHMPTSTTIRGLEDMLSSPLGQHILSYEPSRGFFIPSFSTYDGSSDPYDHMLHFNQVMIPNGEMTAYYAKCSQPARGARPGLVPQTPTEIYQLVQWVVGCICFPIPMLSSTEGKHQFSTNHLQAGGRVHL